MKRSFGRTAASLLSLAALALPGCLYAHTKEPLDTDLLQTKLGAKTGTAKTHEILWMVMWGDASTQAAATSAGITQLNHADMEDFVILGGLYWEHTTIVYGD
jgi:hypothetical protein